MVGTVLVSIAATISALLATAGVAASIFWLLRRRLPAPERVTIGDRPSFLDELGARLATLETTVKGLPSLWEEERERARKHADRAAAAYRSASDILAELEGSDDGAEAAPGVLPIDGTAGETGGVSPLRLGMGENNGSDAADADLKRRYNEAMGYPF